MVLRDGSSRLTLLRRDETDAIAALAFGVERRTERESRGCNRRGHPGMVPRGNPDPSSKFAILTLSVNQTLFRIDRPS
jgi:hypothetical protein